jgi:hypothetical protein
MKRRQFLTIGSLSTAALCCGCAAALKREEKMLLTIDDSLAVCGLDCTACNIYQAAKDPAKAEKLAADFRAWRFPEAVPEWFQCQGCRSDRSKHWSDNCQILQCCHDEKGHDVCIQCDEFPCEKLEEWAAGGEKYQQALDRLKNLKEAIAS